MLSGNGVVRCSNGHLMATFGINGRLGSFTGTISTGTFPLSFDNMTANVTYNSIVDLTGSRYFEGFIGHGSLCLEVINGVFLHGELRCHFSEEVLISGNLRWIQV
jgi:hypothetical protein